MCSVTKKDIVDHIVQKTNLKRNAVREVTQEVLNTITEELINGNRIELRDFGVFEPVFRPGKTAQNPKTLEPVFVPPKYSVRFKPGRYMKDAVANGNWAQSQLDQRTESKSTEKQDGTTTTKQTTSEPPIVETVSQSSESRQHTR